MPDMRDYIAMYLAGGRGGMPMGGGPPGAEQGVQMPGWPAPPPGGYPPPTPYPGPQGPNPGGTVPPPPPEFYRGGRGLFEPDSPSPYPFPSQGMPDDTSGLMPPADTPMQAPDPGPPPPEQGPPLGPMQESPGMQVGGMDPQQWLRMYRGG